MDVAEHGEGRLVEAEVVRLLLEELRAKEPACADVQSLDVRRRNRLAAKEQPCDALDTT